MTIIYDDEWSKDLSLTASQRYYRRHREMCLAKNRITSKTPKKKAYQREYQKKNREKVTEIHRKWLAKHPHYDAYLSQKIHYLAIDKLGGKCSQCGVLDKRLLQINHMNGGGIKELRPYPHGFYRRIVNGKRKTEDLDIRCANCNILYEYERGVRREWTRP